MGTMAAARAQVLRGKGLNGRGRSGRSCCWSEHHVGREKNGSKDGYQLQRAQNTLHLSREAIGTYCSHHESFSALRPQRQYCNPLRRGIHVCNSASLNPVLASNSDNDCSSAVRCRFAPSPTGNLHVGGARTALFNWLFARRFPNGKFILRVEDTDRARSTKESELAVLRDLHWLGLHWDEGPDVGGEFGPYRQSERTDEGVYEQYVTQLLEEDKAYRCFCTDEELAAMRAEAEQKKLPPKYSGKWASASEDEVNAMLEEGKPYAVRFRVPQDDEVIIQDIVRGEVRWSTDTLGDFVILRSNGLPVYNFCVAIDDAMMRISHVLRAEEHLPNTLRQVLVYDALGFKKPIFGHISLILAPDKSKLSKRHGATSVGEFADLGYLPEAMVNYLSMLGWNDGTEQEIFDVPGELIDKFSLDRITKSAAVFDKTKLTWMNGQHLRGRGDEIISEMIGTQLQKSDLVRNKESVFVSEVSKLISSSIELVSQADEAMMTMLAYPLDETLASASAKDFIEDGFADLAQTLILKYESGEMPLEADKFKAFVKSIGKETDRKGKRLFMPCRIALTGSMKGPEVGEVLSILKLADGEVTEKAGLVNLEERMRQLKDTVAAHFCNKASSESVTIQ